MGAALYWLRVIGCATLGVGALTMLALARIIGANAADAAQNRTALRCLSVNARAYLHIGGGPLSLRQLLGGHGHSRWREFILGGARRRLLDAARLPLFMSH